MVWFPHAVPRRPQWAPDCTKAIEPPFRKDVAMSSRFEILVEGIDDTRLVDEVETAIRQAFHEMALPGAWRVVVKPSRTSGRWDFSVYGLDVRHVLSIAVPPNLLPDLIPRRLQESLNRAGLCPDAYAADRRPAHTSDPTITHYPVVV
jgi:hypothetical protein